MSHGTAKSPRQARERPSAEHEANLSGMGLISLKLHNCPQLTDLTPLAETKTLTSLTLPPNAKDIEFLRTFPKLERFGAQPPFPRPPVFAEATTGRPARPNGSFRGLPQKAKS